jgi:hypothetical protein
MFPQGSIYFDVIRSEHEQAVSPVRLERRQAARMLEALRCCTGPSLATRLRTALGRPATTCCATA